MWGASACPRNLKNKTCTRPLAGPRRHRRVEHTLAAPGSPSSRLLPGQRERESHLLNPPPGSTDPERFATVSIGIGDRVLFHPAPREPRHEWCEVSLRTEAGQFAGSDLPWPVRWVIRPPPPSHVISSPHGSSNTQATKLAACKTLGIPSLELDSGSQAVRKC